MLYLNWIPPDDILSNLKKNSIGKTAENYQGSKFQTLIGDPDFITITKWTQNRIQDRLIACIIKWMIITTNFQHKYNLPDNPMSNFSIEINYLSHILLKCNNCSAHRVQLWNKFPITHSNILFSFFLSPALINKC